MTPDVLVVGGGTAGAAAAAFLAEAGLSVVLTDARALDKAGARWVNGVPPWLFDAAGIARPVAPERRPSGAFMIKGVSGAILARVDDSPIWAVDMRGLVNRLHERGAKAGVQVLAPAKIRAVRSEGDRVAEVDLTTPSGTVTIRPRLFVDASGMNAAIRRRSPYSGDWPDVPSHHICSAAQEVRRLLDPGGAANFFAEHDCDESDTVCSVGVSGGYSISNIAVDGDEVDLLCGAIATPQYRSGPRILKDTVADNPWIGERLFGGASAIPLRRPYDRLVAPGLALVGNAACQVFSTHGSGIGFGMVAGRMLADAVATASDPGDEAVLWRYAHAFHTRFGPLLALYDLFRRQSQRFDGAEVDRLFAAGLLNRSGFEAGLNQELPLMGPRDGLATLAGAVREPALTARFGSTAARAPLAMRAYQRYPESPDRARLARWSTRVARAFGDPVDIR